jgi:hypothetical protein
MKDFPFMLQAGINMVKLTNMQEFELTDILRFLLLFFSQIVIIVSSLNTRCQSSGALL